jgi:hypothetical protein
MLVSTRSGSGFQSGALRRCSERRQRYGTAAVKTRTRKNPHAVALGRLGGLVRSAAKKHANKENSRKGGLVKSRKKTLAARSDARRLSIITRNSPLLSLEIPPSGLFLIGGARGGTPPRHSA